MSEDGINGGVGDIIIVVGEIMTDEGGILDYVGGYVDR